MNLKEILSFIPYVKKYSLGSQRSKEIIKNIMISFSMRCANIIAGLLLVPMTINYLNPTRYGIWLTISSIIGWVSLFDFGLGNGFRNRFAEAKAKGDLNLADKYVSTTYVVLAVIISVALFVILMVNCFIDWPKLLGVNNSYKEELTMIFAIIVIFTCANMVANIICALLNADQKNGYASVIQATGQYISLFAIFILSKTTEGSLTNLALYYSGIPCIVTMVISCFIFSRGSYKRFRPSFGKVQFSLTKSIMNLGVQFFIIHLCMIAVFQIVNMVISRELGPDAVTQYNVANKYFNILYMSVTIMMTPFWSAFTDAYAQQDINWMRSIYRKLKIFISFSFILYIILGLFANYAYNLWVGKSVSVSSNISYAMALLVFIQTYCTVNMYIINGMGVVRVQTVVFTFFALIAWSCLSFSCRFGLLGVMFFLSFVYLVLGVLGQVQIGKILNKSAKGFWLK